MLYARMIPSEPARNTNPPAVTGGVGVNDNFGFVPFTQEEFYRIVDDMLLIMDKHLFMFLYIKGEAAAFFGGVPNVTEKMQPMGFCKRCELLRAAKMILTKGKTKGFRLGYLGVKQKFRKLGLPAVMLWKEKIYYNFFTPWGCTLCNNNGIKV